MSFSPFLASLLMWTAALFPIVAAGQPLRVGWQTPWATQGQLVTVLKKTNIAKLAGIDMTFLPFSYGAPLNRAAMAEEVDVLFTADQPAMTLLARTDKFRVVSRFMYNRVCVYVPPTSTIRQFSDLRDGVLMGPSGAAAERYALSALSTAGVDTQKIRRGSLDMGAQLAMAKANAGKSRWPSADAFYGFDPIPAKLEHEGLARMVGCGKVLGVIVARASLLQGERKEQLNRFLRAVHLAWTYYASNPALANEWYLQESGLQLDPKVLDHAAAVEPNRHVSSSFHVSLQLSSEDIDMLEAARQFLVREGIIPGDARPLAFVLPEIARDYAVASDLEELAKGVRPL